MAYSASALKRSRENSDLGTQDGSCLARQSLPVSPCCLCSPALPSSASDSDSDKRSSLPAGSPAPAAAALAAAALSAEMPSCSLRDHNMAMREARIAVRVTRHAARAATETTHSAKWCLRRSRSAASLRGQRKAPMPSFM